VNQLIGMLAMDSPMTYEQPDDREAFETLFLSFTQALQVLSHDAATQCEEMGNYNAPWEIQHDVQDGCFLLLRSPETHLTGEQSEALRDLTEALENLPREAVAPTGMTTTNHEGCLTAMRHPAWISLRERAVPLLQLLVPLIQKNAAYFKGQ